MVDLSWMLQLEDRNWKKKLQFPDRVSSEKTSSLNGVKR